MKRIVVITLLALVGNVGFAQKGKVKEPVPGSKQVQFFPNPASTFINFEFKTLLDKGSVIQFYSFLGRKMASMPVTGSRMQVNLTEFITGIYIFQVRDAAGRMVESNKFQVTK